MGKILILFLPKRLKKGRPPENLTEREFLYKVFYMILYAGLPKVLCDLRTSKRAPFYRHPREETEGHRWREFSHLCFC